MTGKTLSVILPNFNHGDLLSRAVVAIFGQSRPPDEFILIDDGSTDDSPQRIESLQEVYPQLQVLRNEKNLGTIASVAQARQSARGDYVFFAAADDYLLPGLFERSLDLLDAHPEAPFCSALTLVEDQDGGSLGEMPTPKVLETPGFIPPARAQELLYRYGGWFRCNTAVYRRQRLDEIGGFDPKLGTFSDAFVCMVFAVRDGACFIPEPGGVMRLGGASQSARMMAGVDTAAEMFSYARELMTTTYGRHFPRRLVAAWEKRCRYSVARQSLETDGPTALERLLAVIPQFTAFDRAVLKILSGLGPWASTPIILYLGLSLVPRDLARAAFGWLRGDRWSTQRRSFHKFPRQS